MEAKKDYIIQIVKELIELRDHVSECNIVSSNIIKGYALYIMNSVCVFNSSDETHGVIVTVRK